MNKQELKELGVSNRAKFRAAIDKGDKAAALALLDENIRNETKLRDAIVGGMNVLLSFIAEKLGEDAVREAMEAWYTRELRPFIGAEAGEKDPEKRMRLRAYVFTGLHDLNIRIEEDDEKFTLTVPCDTGGVLVGKKSCGRTRARYPWSNDEQGMAYYCTHCTITYQDMFTRDFGFPDYIVFPPKKAGGLCVQYLYKDPAKIPAKYRSRFVGGKKG